jgi:putative ABC transport system permease protein
LSSSIRQFASGVAGRADLEAAGITDAGFEERPLVRVRSDDRITWAAGRLAGRFGASGRLAAAAVERAPRRIWTTTVIVAIAGAIAVSTRGATQNQVSTIAAKLALLADVDFFVQTVPADDLPAGPYCRRAGVRSWRPPPGSRRSWRASSPYATVGRQRERRPRVPPRRRGRTGVAA